MGKNSGEKAESDVGKVYCRQCHKLLDRSALSAGRSNINLKCAEGHSVQRIGSGWIEGLLGFACPWSLLHISALVKTDYPVPARLLLVSLPVMGFIFLTLGLLAKKKLELGMMNAFTLHWRGNVGFSGGLLMGSALAIMSYDLNLVEF